MKIFKYTIYTFLIASGLFFSCESHTYEEIEGAPEVIPEVVTYTNDVKAIINANCVSCHAPGGVAGHRPLTTYSEVKNAVENTDLLDRIQRQSSEVGAMPQGGRMPQSRIDIILQWNDNGLPE